jgi:hypothetical protein
MYAPDATGNKPTIVLDKIVLNQPIPAERFIFPREKLLASGMPTKQLKLDAATQGALSMVTLMRALMARIALGGGAEARSRLEKMGPGKLDWEKVREQDKKAGTLLRSVFRFR